MTDSPYEKIFGVTEGEVRAPGRPSGSTSVIFDVLSREHPELADIAKRRTQAVIREITKAQAREIFEQEYKHLVERWT